MEEYAKLENKLLKIAVETQSLDEATKAIHALLALSSAALNFSQTLDNISFKATRAKEIDSYRINLEELDKINKHEKQF